MPSRNNGPTVLVDGRIVPGAWEAHVRETGLGRFDDVHQPIA